MMLKPEKLCPVGQLLSSPAQSLPAVIIAAVGLGAVPGARNALLVPPLSILTTSPELFWDRTKV